MIPSRFWDDLRVAFAYDPAVLTYPPVSRCPFDPDTRYPEYSGPLSLQPNAVYGLVRRALRLLARDEPHFGTADWNPLRGLVEPGMKVVIKPNLVADTVREHADIDALFTNMSVVRPVVDYLNVALAGKGSITIGDAPIQRTDWANLMEVSGLAGMVVALADRGAMPISIVDFRREVTVRDQLGMVISRERRDAVDYVEVDLGQGSTLMPVIGDYRRFRVSQYDPSALLTQHNPTRNCYMVHRSILDADVVLNMPKLKLHKKAGITCCLKNLVGMVCGKDWLPHYRVGDAESGAGDQYEFRSRLHALYSVLCDAMEVGGAAKRRFASLAAKGVRGLLLVRGMDRSSEGNWYGNDTTWRMVHDLNLIACYADHTGKMTDRIQRVVLNVVDGVVGGERDCPLQPTAHPAGVVLAGTNPLAVDAVAATVMGMDVAKIPLLRNAWNAPAAWQLPPAGGKLQDVRIRMDDTQPTQETDLEALSMRINLAFQAPVLWANRIERKAASQ